MRRTLSPGLHRCVAIFADTPTAVMSGQPDSESHDILPTAVVGNKRLLRPEAPAPGRGCRVLSRTARRSPNLGEHSKSRPMPRRTWSPLAKATTEAAAQLASPDAQPRSAVPLRRSARRHKKVVSPLPCRAQLCLSEGPLRGILYGSRDRGRTAGPRSVSRPSPGRDAMGETRR
jgi:hypothetical protein